MPYKKYFLLIPVILVMGIAFVYKAPPKNDLPLNPEVFISSDNLLQADTLLVVVKGKANQVTGSLGEEKLHFYSNENNKDWVAIVGIPFNKNPGSQKLTVNTPDKILFEKEITILKRDFAIKPLVVTQKLKQKGYTAKKIISTIENKENKTLNAILDIINPEVYFKKPFVYPLSEIIIVGNYGEIRKHENYKIRHLGVDLKAPLGTPVYAVNNGQVVFEESLPDYGKTIIIDHGSGIYSLYLHLADFKIKHGDKVKQGDLIGLSGDSGYSTGPHLHFSVKVRKASVDPLKFIETTQLKW